MSAAALHGRRGNVVGWIHDHGGIVAYPANRWVLFAGNDGALHSWRTGAHVGWFQDGWVPNTNGRHVAFAAGALGGAKRRRWHQRPPQQHGAWLPETSMIGPEPRSSFLRRLQRLLELDAVAFRRFVLEILEEVRHSGSLRSPHNPRIISVIRGLGDEHLLGRRGSL